MDRACAPCTDACVAGEYLATACTATEDAACAACVIGTNYCPGGVGAAALPCSGCGLGEYTAWACNVTDDDVCRSCTVCGPGENQTKPCDATSDATCDVCPVGYFCPGDTHAYECAAECAPGLFQTRPCNLTHDTGCEEYANDLIDCTAVARKQTVVGGYAHFCMLFEHGRIKCFGRNTAGVLGQGSLFSVGQDVGLLQDSLNDASLPFVDLGTGAEAEAICAGHSHTCALLTGGAVKCWGLNDKGQLGIQSTVDKGGVDSDMGDNLQAVDLGTLGVPVKIACGGYHTCAVLSDQSVRCWGENANGQLGIGQNGGTYGGAPGDGMGDALPVVDVDDTVEHIACAETFTCVSTTSSGVKCWGAAPGYGDTNERGHLPGDMGASLGAVDLLGTSPVVGVRELSAVGPLTMCVLFANGRAKCWGTDDNGRLGNGFLFSDVRGDAPGEMGDTLPYLDPVGSSLIETISTSVYGLRNCMVLAGARSGEVVCVGNFVFDANSATIQFGLTETPVFAVAQQGLFNSNACFLTTSGALRCYGSGYFGLEALGTAKFYTAPTAELNLGASASVRVEYCELCPDRMTLAPSIGGVYSNGVRRISGAFCAVFQNRRVKCWGYNSDGVLGQGVAAQTKYGVTTTDLRTMPYVDLGTGETVAKLSMGWYHVCVLLDSKTIKCWGRNTEKQLGYGDTTNRGTSAGHMGINLPTVNVGAQQPVDVVCGRTNTCALLADGTVKCWGDNANVATMDFATGGVPVVQLAPSGNTHGNCALLANGDIKCRDGAFSLGVLDIGAPAAVVGIVAIMNNAWCAWFADGRAKCWGFDSSGALGNGADATYYYPTLGVIDSNLPFLALSDPAWKIEVIFGGIGGSAQCALLQSKEIVCWGFEVGDAPVIIGTAGADNAYGAVLSPDIGDGRVVLVRLDLFGVVHGYGTFLWGLQNSNDPQELVESTPLDFGPDPVGELNCVGCTVCAASEYISDVCVVESNTECTVCSAECVHSHIQQEVAACSESADLQCEFTCSPALTGEYVARSAKSISAGLRHVCVILDDSTMKCWGRNNVGQTGTNIPGAVCDSAAEDYSDLPTLNFGPSRTVKAAACGAEYTCALLDNDALKCWGDNSAGQLGKGDAVSTAVGVNLAVLPAVVFDGGTGTGEYATEFCTASDHACAVLSNFTVACWGTNAAGALGLPGVTQATRPRVVDIGLRALAAGVECTATQTCVVLAEPRGAVKCWGEDTPYGDTLTRGLDAAGMGNALPVVDFGVNATTDYVDRLERLAGRSLCAFFAGGGAPKCWGYASSWLLRTESLAVIGDDETGASIPFLDIGDDESGRIAALSGGFTAAHACAALISGEVLCWGSNANFILGNAANTQAITGLTDPVPAVPAIYDVVRVVAMASTTCALRVTGAVVCWGGSSSGERCNGATGSASETQTEARIGASVRTRALDCYACSLCPDTHIVLRNCSALHDTMCEPCPAGEFANAARDACFACAGGFDCSSGAPVACGGGTYNAGDGQSSGCQPCSTACPTDDEYFATVCNATHDAVCLPCPLGHKCINSTSFPCPIDTYANDNHDECLACPANSHADAASHLIPACICEAGYRQCNSTKHLCVDCAEGSYCPGDETAYACPDAHHLTPARSDGPEDCFCMAGYYGTAWTACMPCPVDFYCPTNSSQPVPCPGNASVHIELSDQETDCSCDAGHYNPVPGFVECYMCPADMYCPGGNVTVPCPGNTTTQGRKGRTSVHDCVALPSFYFAGGNTTGGAPARCTEGYWCAGGLHDRVLCPSDSSSPAGSDAVTDCVCNAYFEGFCVDTCNGMCDPCPADRWCPGGAVVNACPNFTSVGEGLAAGPTECLCVAGYVGSGGGPCAPCPADSYCPGGDNQQLACPFQMSVSEGASNRLQCSCNAGYYGSAGALAGCIECDADTYCEGAPGDGQNALQRACPDHSTTGGVTGVSAIAACVCNAGYWSDDGNNCLVCDDDYYCIGDESRLACEANASSVAGSDTPADCACDPGYTGEDGGTCLQCPANSYCEGSNHIQACDANAQAPAGATAATDCKCNAGYAGVGTVAGGGCTLCRTGYWCPGGSVNSPENACPANALSVPGSDELTDCVCAASFWGAYGGACSLCEPNFWCPGGDQNISCAGNSSSFAASSEATHCVCNPGYKGPNGGPCALCGSGEVCLGGANASSCPPNSNAPAGTADLSACECNQRYVGDNGGVCLACGVENPNHYCPGGNESVPCPAFSSSPLLAGARDECLCDATRVGPAGGPCNACVAGFYCPGGTVDATAIECPTNSSSVALSDALDDCKCVPGFVGATAAECSLCPQNYYCTGDNEIEPCDAGNEADPKSQTPAGASQATDCKCIPGYYGNDGAVCLSCAADNFCVGGAVQRMCTPNSNAPALSDSEDDCVCAPGFYYVVSSNISETEGYAFTCELCPANFYCPGNTTDPPLACYNNTAAPPGSNERNDCLCVPEWYSDAVGLECKQCETGFYCPGGTSRQSCPENTVAAVGSTTEEACECVAGFYGSSPAACLRCPVASYCEGHTHIAACPPFSNTTSGDGGAGQRGDCACYSGFFGSPGLLVDCLVCPDGQYCEGGDHMQTCPPHTETFSNGTTWIGGCKCVPTYYLASGGVVGDPLPVCGTCPNNFFCAGDTHIESCPNHTESPALSGDVEDCTCVPGYVGADPYACALCAVGMYCEGDEHAAACPAFSNTTGAGANTLDDCSCNPGYYGEPAALDSCEECPQDAYCLGGPENGTVASPCAPYSGTWGATGASWGGDCVCNAGYYRSGGGVAGEALPQCTICPANHYCAGGDAFVQCPNHTLAGVRSSMVEHCLCAPGYYGANGGPCALCESDSYCSGGSSIVECAGYASSASGSERLDDCECDAGFYGEAGGPCAACPVDRWCPGGPDNRNEGCALFSSAPPRSSAETDCVCDGGYWAVALPLALGGPGLQCEACPAGMYCEHYAPWRQPRANACPSNAVSPPMSTMVTDCYCPPGFFGRNGTACQECPAGQFCLGWSNETMPCPEFSHVTGGAAVRAHCVCDPGYYGPDGGPCVFCPAGSFCPGLGNNSIEACPNRTHSTELSRHIHNCSCVAGYVSASGGGYAPCEPCAAGSYCPGGAVQETCPGNASSVGGAGAVEACLCLGRYFGPHTGPCTPCEMGYYCPGGTGQILCPMHSTAPPAALTESECLCDPGFVGADPRACVACPFGLYCAGNTSIATCPVHANTSGVGSATFADCMCAAGYFMNVTLRECAVCRVGFFCPGDNVEYACPGGVGIRAGAQRIGDCACPDGEYRVSAESVCVPCAAGLYCKDGFGRVCPANSTSPEGAIEFTECVCHEGFFLAAIPTLHRYCLPCQDGFFCAGQPPVRRECNYLLACPDWWYRTECTSSRDHVCVYCNGVVPGNATVSHPAGGGGAASDEMCNWECNSGFFKDGDECRLCSGGGCAYGETRAQCGKGSETDAECESCVVPEHSFLVLDQHGGSQGCVSMCKRGFWWEERSGRCCSDAAFYHDGGGMHACECLPGWVGDGSVCAI